MIGSLSEMSHDLLGEQGQKLLKAVVEEVSLRRSKLLFWGLNPTCVSVLKEMSFFGLLSAVVGIVDSQNAGKEVFHFKVVDITAVSKLNFDALVITDDAQKEVALVEFSKADSRLPLVIVAGTFGYPNMLIHIYQSIRYLISNKIEGAVAEFGVYQGGTSAFIAKTLRTFGSSCRIYGFDTFAGFPERKNVLDLFRERKYEFAEYETIRNYLEPLGVELIRGDISNTFKRIEGIPLIFTFFDTDNYTPTRDALELCYEQTVKGGIIAFDHYYCDEKWLNTIGERIAAKQVLSQKNMFNLHGTGIFLKF